MQVSQPMWQTMEIEGATTAFMVLGEGPPLVLIHGLSGSSRWWRHNVRPLSQHFRTYVVDLTGFGASRGFRFVLRDAAKHLIEWMDRLDIPRASLVGHSMGGHIVADLAAEYPQRVERLVLVDAAVLPFGRNYVQHARSMAREFRQVRLRFLPILATDALRAGPGTLWRAADELLRADLRPKLERIVAPTMLVWGEHDALVPLSLGQALCKVIVGSELVVLAHAGHNAMWDCPSAFNREVSAFLQGNGPVAGERTVPCS